MRIPTLIRYGVAFCVIAVLVLVPTGNRTLASPAHYQVRTHAATQHVWTAGHLPLSFEVNRGQADPRFAFVAHAGLSMAFIGATGTTFALGQGFVSSHLARAGAQMTGQTRAGRAERELAPTRLAAGVVSPGRSTATAQLQFLGANRSAHIQATHRLPGMVNYLYGSDPHNWRMHIPTYSSITIHSLYPGVDLVYHGLGQQLEYDWVVRPGARTSAIRFNLSGSGHLRFGRDGSLVLATAAGDLVQELPQASLANGQHVQTISAQYVRGGTSIFGLALGRYDRSKTLVVDPVLRYASYLGGSMVDTGKGIAVDSAGNMYMTGITASTDFPTKGSYQGNPTAKGGALSSHVFVTKINAAGNAMIFSTYLGGSGFEDGYAIQADSTGVYIAGDTNSRDFPTVHAFQPKYGGGGTDAFIAKLTPAGDALAYSSYLGGPSDDAAFDMAIDTSGNAFMTGQTIRQFRSSGGNAAPPLGHTYVARIGTDGSLVYQLPIAGSFSETGYGVAVDSQDNAYVVGVTDSPDFPSNLTPVPGLIGPSDGFVLKVDPTGKTILYSTHLGGSDLTTADSVAVDADGNAYVSGQTAAPDFPIVGGFQRQFAGQGRSFFPGDAFVAKLDQFGRVIYSTYLGGSRDEEALRIALDHSKNIYVAGWTDSADFPTKNAVQPAFTGAACLTINGQQPCSDAFAAEIQFDGQLLWSTFLGGSGSDYGNAIAVTPAGKVYVAGTTDSRDMPTVAPLRAQNSGPDIVALDAFMVELDPGTTPVSHALVLDRIGMFRQVGRQLVEVKTIKQGERVVVLATYHDNRGKHVAFGTLEILRGGRQVLQYSMQVGTSGGSTAARSSIQLSSPGEVGKFVAKVAIISDGATAFKSISFKVTKR